MKDGVVRRDRHSRVFNPVVIVTRGNTNEDDSQNEAGNSNEKEANHAVDTTAPSRDRTRLVTTLTSTFAHFQPF